MAKTRSSRIEFWRQMVDEQERSGLAVRRFCEQAQVNEHSFYNWRARLRKQESPVRFALVEPSSSNGSRDGEAWIELMLASGDRLRVGNGAAAATVRMLVAALRP